MTFVTQLLNLARILTNMGYKNEMQFRTSYGKEIGITITATIVELGLHDHVGDEMRGLTSLFKMSLNFLL